MRTMIRDGLGAITALTVLGVLSIGGIAYAQDDEPSQDCLAKRQQLVAVQADLDAAIAGALPTVPALTTQVNVLVGLVADACPAEPGPTDDPAPTTDTPLPTETAVPVPTEEPTTPTTPGVDLDCADLGPGEADRLLREDPSDPNNLDRNNNGVPCEIDEFGDEPTVTPPNSNSNSGNTSGSGSNSQFDTMPSTAPETGRA